MNNALPVKQIRKTGRKIVKGDKLVDGNGITATISTVGRGFYGEIAATFVIDSGPNEGAEMTMALRPGGKYDVIPA